MRHACAATSGTTPFPVRCSRSARCSSGSGRPSSRRASPSGLRQTAGSRPGLCCRYFCQPSRSSGPGGNGRHNSPADPCVSDRSLFSDNDGSCWRPWRPLPPVSAIVLTDASDRTPCAFPHSALSRRRPLGSPTWAPPRDLLPSGCSVRPRGPHCWHPLCSWLLALATSWLPDPARNVPSCQTGAQSDFLS